VGEKDLFQRKIDDVNLVKNGKSSTTVIILIYKTWISIIVRSYKYYFRKKVVFICTGSPKSISVRQSLSIFISAFGFESHQDY
jgi:hypothetical protein